jgi:hypothetical protein
MQEVDQKSFMSRVVLSEKIDVRSDIGEFAQETCTIPPLQLPGVVVMEVVTVKELGSRSFTVG